MSVKNIARIAFVFLLIVAATLQIAHTQDQPGLLRFPAALDSHDSLFRTPLSPIANYAHAIAYAHLTTSITASSTSITVDDASTFPASGVLVIGHEVIYYTTKTGNTFSGLTRGANSTVAASHSAVDEDVRMSILPVYHDRLVDAIIAIETKLGTGTTIDPLKIGAGNVNSTKFGYLANLTSDVQTQLNTIPTTSLYNALTLQNSWTSAGGAWGSPTYSRTGNMVCWQGLLVSGSNATVVFTLPAGARPNADTILTASSEAGWCRFNIVSSTGAVTVNNYTGSVLSLSGVCYVVP